MVEVEGSYGHWTFAASTLSRTNALAMKAETTRRLERLRRDGVHDAGGAAQRSGYGSAAKVAGITWRRASFMPSPASEITS